MEESKQTPVLHDTAYQGLDELSGPCWVCGTTAVLCCDTCQRWLCEAHTFLRRQAVDRWGVHGIDVLCADHAEPMPGYMVDPPMMQETR